MTKSYNVYHRNKQLLKSHHGVNQLQVHGVNQLQVHGVNQLQELKNLR